MKKDVRCPVCGSHNINELADVKPGNESNEAKGQPAETNAGNDATGGKPRWKCYDCYRKFEKPDENTK